MRALFRFTLWATAGLVASTVFVEIGLRLVEASPLWRILPASEIAMYGPDYFTGYRHRANAHGIWLKEARSEIRISSLGLRDRERKAARTSRLRAVVVGDSIIEAVQVDLRDTAVVIAEGLLAAKHKGAEVINLGLAGANPPVMAARLKSLGTALQPDIAVVVVNIGDFLSGGLGDDSAFTGYRQNPSNVAELSFRFRDSRGYRFRTSIGGDALYWLLDHSAVARVLNSRRNIGLFAEWPKPLQSESSPAPCGASFTAQAALWIDGMPPTTNSILKAFLRDLSEIKNGDKISVIFAIRGLGIDCPQQADARHKLLKAIEDRVAENGVKTIDLDRSLHDHAGSAGLSSLYGFGPSLGRGHLNQAGNRILGTVLYEAIAMVASSGS